MKSMQFQFIVVLLSLLGIGMIEWAWAGDDNYGDYDEDVSLNFEPPDVATKQKPVKKQISDIELVNNQLYEVECGSCHFPFQPGLLPARSWGKLMSNLSNHFGENAELTITDHNQIKDYLISNAAETSHYRLPIKILDFIMTDDAQIRITKNMYIAYEHRSIPKKMIQENPKVRSLSRCNVCHIRAEKGFYTESEVMIPGFGKWEAKIMH